MENGLQISRITMTDSFDFSHLGKIDKRPQKGWWAPGNYIQKCALCGEDFIGDKRAGWCADCAYKDSNETPTTN